MQLTRKGCRILVFRGIVVLGVVNLWVLLLVTSRVGDAVTGYEESGRFLLKSECVVIVRKWRVQSNVVTFPLAMISMGTLMLIRRMRISTVIRTMRRHTTD
jgi:hypothetical protein